MRSLHCIGSILVAEYKEENLSEEKKRSLSAEVYRCTAGGGDEESGGQGTKDKLATSE